MKSHLLILFVVFITSFAFPTDQEYNNDRGSGGDGNDPKEDGEHRDGDGKGDGIIPAAAVPVYYDGVFSAAAVPVYYDGDVSSATVSDFYNGDISAAAVPVNYDVDISAAGGLVYYDADISEAAVPVNYDVDNSAAAVQVSYDEADNEVPVDEELPICPPGFKQKDGKCRVTYHEKDASL